MRLELVLTLAAVVHASTCCQIALGENLYQNQQGQSSISSGEASSCTPSCQNGGLCRQIVNSEAYYCDCSGTGYTGVSCSAPSKGRLLTQSSPPASSTSACTPTCQNGGLCTQAVNSDVYYCDCSSTGYTGATCAILSDGGSPPTSTTSACTPACQNGGMCTQGVNSEAYYCDCSSTGYTGATCSTPSNSSSLPTGNTPVSSGPPSSASACIPACQNGGVCTQAVNSDVYYCDCSSTGYKGATCSAPSIVSGAPASSTSPCTPACQNGGACRQAVNSEAYYCDCSGTGFKGAACRAQDASSSPAAAIPAVGTSASECTPACQNGGSCVQAVNSDVYYCDCSSTGFRGASCSAQMTAYSPAPSAASSLSACSPPCKNGGACTQAVNSDVYYCDCQSTGFSGQDCSILQGGSSGTLKGAAASSQSSGSGQQHRGGHIAWWGILLIVLACLAAVVLVGFGVAAAVQRVRNYRGGNFARFREEGCFHDGTPDHRYGIEAVRMSS